MTIEQKSVIAKIQEEIIKLKYIQYSNRWNIANQLIDIVAADASAAEIVEKDLHIPEMSVEKMVKEINIKQLADPMKITNEIARFYGITVPAFLPPEYWRTAAEVPASCAPPLSPKITPIKFSLADFMK